MLSINNPEYENVEVGNVIETFIERIAEHNSTIYFHNLRFDGIFIIDYLLRQGFKHRSGDRLSEKAFKSLISSNNQFYSITIMWENGHTCELRDSYKKIPMPVSRVAKSFKLEETKGSIDYELFRAIGHVLTAEEDDYLRRDVVIMGKAMKEVLDSGMKGLTVAGDSLREYKRLSGTSHFDRLFPVLNDSIDSEIRRAYRGGFTYADKRFKGRVVGGGVVLDVNSLYPSVMMNDILPYGEPEYFRGSPKPTKTRPLTIFSVTFTAKLKSNHIPCIQIKGSSIFNATEYLKEIVEPTTLMVTNVDWELYKDHYDIDILAFGGGWRFKAATGMFDEYIGKWSKIKESETGGKREIAKLHLNALYGKFATNPNHSSKIPTMKDNAVKLVRGEDEKGKPVYTAMGVFITSYARDLTIRAAQDNYEVFAYADTDSLHLLMPEPPTNLDIHPTRMGAWKVEYYFDSAFYIRAKAYSEHLRDMPENVHGESCDSECNVRHDYVTRIAGVPTPVSAQLTFNDLYEGNVLVGKLAPKIVPGGVVLKDVPYELRLS